MAKQSMYFESYDDVIQYYGSLESIPSKHLVIVQESGAIYANSNNAPGSGGQTEEQGGEPISEIDKELVDNTLYGEEGKPLDDGWYLVGDTGNVYKFNYTGEGVEYDLKIEDTNWDLPGYILSIKDRKETNWYPSDTVVYNYQNDIYLYDDSDRYGENRIIIAKGGTLKLNGTLLLREYIVDVSDGPVINWYEDE